MSIEVKVPVLPESVSDATIASWHKKAGDSVRRDENLVDLETDKVVLEVPAPQDGVLKEILKDEGELVTAEEVLAMLEPGEVSDSADESDSADQSKEDKKAKPQESDKGSDDQSESPDTDDLSPAVRRLVQETNLNPSDIKGSGRDGRITKEDVLKFMKDGGSESQPSSSGKKPLAAGRTEERVAMSRLRARIAERMVEAQQTAAILTSFNEVDLKAVMDMRRQYKEQFEKTHGVRLGLMSFFVKAAARALQRHPVVNASVEDSEIIYHNYQDIGIAVATERGLVVPILRDAQNMSMADIENGIGDYAKKAREGGLAMEDLQGGTFTITNGGVFGSLVSTPILNPPQSAILGMHTIKERAVVVDGEVVARPMMYIALSYDHRIIDGKDAVLFLVDIKNSLEDPSRLLLDL